MKHAKKIGTLCFLIAFAFILTTSFLFRESSNITKNLAVPAYNITDIALTPGSDQAYLNFAWYSANSTTISTVQVALKSDMIGSKFPSNKEVTFNGTSSAGNEGHFSNKVTANGFKESTAYVYRLGDGTNWSPVYNYTTQSTSQYSVLIAGDPQIGASGNVANDGVEWEHTINKATAKFPDVSFLLSVGDQVNNGNEVKVGAAYLNESEYTAFLKPAQFTGLPIAAIPGNHETYVDGHISHLNSPNMSMTYGTVQGSTTGGDYYFTYGNTLYMMLNSNNMDEDGHKVFMKNAIAASPSATWRIVSLHHAVYSSAIHESNPDIISRRLALVPILDKLGIDVVLDGHDHCYTRTYQMMGGVALATNFSLNGNALNPKGTLYITFDSASGSKYYKMTSPNLNNYYEAVKKQIDVPTFSLMRITENDFRITTYRADTMVITDTYTIIKR